VVVEKWLEDVLFDERRVRPVETFGNRLLGDTQFASEIAGRRLLWDVVQSSLVRSHERLALFGAQAGFARPVPVVGFRIEAVEREFEAVVDAPLVDLVKRLAVGKAKAIVPDAVLARCAEPDATSFDPHGIADDLDRVAQLCTVESSVTEIRILLDVSYTPVLGQRRLERVEIRTVGPEVENGPFRVGRGLLGQLQCHRGDRLRRLDQRDLGRRHAELRDYTHTRCYVASIEIIGV